MAAKCRSGIINLGMKPKVEYLNMAKNSQWFKIPYNHTEIKRWRGRGEEEMAAST